LDFDFGLAGRTALVTGAASGIGAAIAAAYAGKGARVAVVDMNLEAAQAWAEGLSGAQAFACDVTDLASVEACVAEVLGAFGRIDVLVNSAGIVDLAPAEDISLRSWQRTLDVNLTGSFLVAQAVGRAMIRQGGRQDRQSRLAGGIGRHRRARGLLRLQVRGDRDDQDAGARMGAGTGSA
jgi:NAD(P)-dependent dehydrogenase (short-subunit alcohol dehydrogenase family)